MDSTPLNTYLHLIEKNIWGKYQIDVNMLAIKKFSKN
jgi:hypothetical protein